MPTPIIAADALAPGTRVVAFARVSEGTQVRNGSLLRQQHAVITGIRERELSIRGIVVERERGKLSEPRPQLERALHLARGLQAGIVATNLSRLLRPEAFDKVVNRNAIPSPEELERLYALADGVLFLATLEPPDLHPSEVHSRAVKQGQATAGNRGGRPSDVPYNVAALISEAVNLKELSYPEIARRYRVSLSSVKRLAQRSQQ